MSNSLALAAVTSTIRYVLDRSLQAPHAGQVGGAAVTTLHPAALTTGDLAGDAGINVYCYLATPNHAGNLTDLPTRRANGTLTSRPVAAIDLHYLVTCYGEESSLEPQRLLGRVVVALKTSSVLTRDVVTAAIAAYSDDAATAFLADADLAAEVELVKLSPTPLSLEEMSKLWGVLDAPYLLSQAYLATVVLVSADAAPTLALPVRQRSLTVSPIAPPQLTDVAPLTAGSPFLSGTVIRLRGSGFRPTTGVVQVRVGPAVLAVGEPAEDSAPVPGTLDVLLTDQVPAGLHAVVVQHVSVAVAGGPPSRVVATSNSLPLLVRPTVTVAGVDADEVTFALSPPLSARQQVSVLLSRLDGAGADQPSELTVVVPPVADGDAPLAQITVPRTELSDGRWLVRVQVDGVQSLPELVGEVYGRPALTLP